MNYFKKIIMFFCFTLIIILIARYFNIENHYIITDFFLIDENNLYQYEGEGNEYAEYSVFIDYTDENKVQRRINNGGTVSVEVLEVKDGMLRRVFQQQETYFVENYINQTNTNEILLMEPIEKGTEWNINDGKRTITAIDVKISTPYDNYKAVEVTTIRDRSESKDYYVKGIGHVKSIFKTEGLEVKSSLKEIITTNLKQEINLYYPSDLKVFYKSTPILFHTNDNIISIIESEYKKPLNNLKSPLSIGSKINNITINDENIIIDLNKKFIDEMNAGSSYESLIIKSIVNTFGQYYQKDKVIINIEQQGYETGHFSFKKDEYILIDLTNTEQIN